MLDSLTGHHHIIHASSPKILHMKECIRKSLSLTSIKDNVKKKYINEKQYSPYKSSL